MKLTEKIVSQVHRVLIYGPPKTGKTQLAGSVAAFKKVIWFDLENGYTTLLKLPEEHKERIEIISLPDTRSYPIAIETLLKVIKGSKVTICEEHGKVSCPTCTTKNLPSVTVELSSLSEDTVVVFDSLTQLTTSAISNITKGKPEDYRLEYGDYANLGKLMEIFLSHIQQANYNVICISHETEAELEDGKVKLVPVAGTRAFSRNTAKYFDHVIYAEVKNKKHNFYSSTTSANNLNTGSRTGVTLEDGGQQTLESIFSTPNVTVSAQSKAVESLRTLGSNLISTPLNKPMKV